MSDPTDAPAGAGATALAPSTPATDSNSPPTPSDIGRMLSQLRTQKLEPEAESAPDPATAQTELAPEANAAPQDEAPSETTETTEPEAIPPIEPPRSWTKEAKEQWQSLPRETQEYLAHREQERDREVRRSQNEAAEQRKAIEAEAQKAEQVRKDYEAKLASVMQTLHDSSPFADIKSLADVEKLQAEDPFRFQQFQIYQWKMQATQQELQQAEQRKAQESQSKWAEHVQKESNKFAESLSEADRAKLQQLNAEAPKFLVEKGFTEQELADYASGKDRLSIYDHRVQSLILDGMKYREAQKAKPVALAKPVPQVQRPGVVQPNRGPAAAIQEASAKLERSGKISDLAALIGAHRRAG